MKHHLTTAFRNDGQLAEVCKILCEHASLPGMWVAASGPTARCEQVLAGGCSGLSAGQQVVFLAAWELWDEDRVKEQAYILRLGFVVRVLTGKYLLPLSTLLVAMAGGPAAVDAWLTKNVPVRRTTSGGVYAAGVVSAACEEARPSSRSEARSC
jgi:hypothetical protein